MKRSWVAPLAALAAFAAAASPAAARHVADGKLRDWRGKATELSGQTALSRGELIYTDWLYDDYGADVDHAMNEPAFRCEGCLTRGDLRYPGPASHYGYNAADLRELRLAADRRGLHVMIALQTMKARDAAVVTLAIDGDARTKGSPAEWPDGSGLRTAGPERFVTTWGRRARLTGPRGTTRLRSTVNLRANAIEVDVPWARLGRLSRRARVWLV